jgi:hypothetical protein
MLHQPGAVWLGAVERPYFFASAAVLVPSDVSERFV